MQLFDPIWWQGLHRLTACQLREEGGGRILSLHKNGGKVEVKSQHKFNEDSSLLAHLMQENLPVVLCIHGGRVRRAILSPEQQEDPVAAVLGVQIGDQETFLLQAGPATHDLQAVALMRRDQASEDLARLKGLPVIGIQISPWAMGSLLSQVSEGFFEKEIQLITESGELFFSQGHPTRRQDLEGGAFETWEVPTLENRLEVEREFLFLYASLLYTLLHPEISSANHTPSQTSKQDYLEGHFLRKLIVATTGVLLLIALSLFGLRHLGGQRLQELKSQHEQHQPLLLVLDKLKAKASSLTELRMQLEANSLRPSKASYFTDQVASVVPSGLILSSFTLYPEVEDYKKARLGIKDGWEMILQGHSQSSAAVATFSQELGKIPEIDQVEVHHSEMDFQKDRYEFLFLLKLQSPNHAN